MPIWAFLALGAAILTSFNPTLYKRILRDADPIIVVWGVTLLAIPLLGLFTFVFTLLISALFLHEIPSTRGLLGVGLVLIGAYWLNHNSGAGWLTPFKSLTLRPGVGLLLLGGLLWAITPLFEKAAIQHTYPESPRFTAFIATMLLTFTLTPLVMTRGKSVITKLSVHRRDLFSAGLIAGVAPVLGYKAFSLGPVGYVTTLFRLSTLMTIIWSFLFLNEHGMAQRMPASFVRNGDRCDTHHYMKPRYSCKDLQSP